MWTAESLDGTAVYLDSNVLVYGFEGPPSAIRSGIGEILRNIHLGRSSGCTSLITRAEVLVQPLRHAQLELADRYRALLSGDGPIVIHGLDQSTVDRAAELRAEYSTLRLADALHLATALQNYCRSFITADKRLTAASGRIRILLLGELGGD
ncbi:MAG: PIN domain-containing protein [Gammaproteobacteria bacterium]|nr:PIN domain-containing protein [Gammaproteobacteria bacterium]